MLLARPHRLSQRRLLLISARPPVIPWPPQLSGCLDGVFQCVWYGLFPALSIGCSPACFLPTAEDSTPLISYGPAGAWTDTPNGDTFAQVVPSQNDVRMSWLAKWILVAMIQSYSSQSWHTTATQGATATISFNGMLPFYSKSRVKYSALRRYRYMVLWRKEAKLRCIQHSHRRRRSTRKRTVFPAILSAGAWRQVGAFHGFTYGCAEEYGFWELS